MNEFRKYNSIENTYRVEFIESIKDCGYDRENYVVQEKVHGANLSFWTNGQRLKVAKRTGFLDAGESFYNYRVVEERYADNVIKAFVAVRSLYPETRYITIFGELFGGHYPHPDVENGKEAALTQKGIYYSPINDFYAFDILVNGEQYIPVEDANLTFELLGFFYAKTLLIGSLEQALSYPNAFETKIPMWLGLPPIEKNICEGVVIKPAESKLFKSGQRIILKNKNSLWEENSGKNRLRLTSEPIREEVERFKLLIEDYINENRLSNVLSKLNEKEAKNAGKLIGLLSKDALEDFEKDYGEMFNELDKKDQKLVKKHLNSKSANLVKLKC
ncbi:MAG: RNA ligase family protein [Bacteroidota bacterium]